MLPPAERPRSGVDHRPDGTPADGFEWGYAGGGPAQLALAILSDCIGAEAARECYQRFEFEVVVALPQAGWELSREDVLAWYRG